jgi:hypothetical protein
MTEIEEERSRAAELHVERYEVMPGRPKIRKALMAVLR